MPVPFQESVSQADGESPWKSCWVKVSCVQQKGTATSVLPCSVIGSKHPQGKCGFAKNTIVNPRGQQLGLSINSAPGSSSLEEIKWWISSTISLCLCVFLWGKHQWLLSYLLRGWVPPKVRNHWLFWHPPDSVVALKECKLVWPRGEQYGGYPKN